MKASQKRKDAPASDTTRQRGLSVVTAVAVTALAFAALDLYAPKTRREQAPLIPNAGQTLPGTAVSDETADPLWPRVKEIAESFLCGCGQCGDMPLVECVCEMDTGGLAEKRYIRDLLTAGRSKAEVVLLVQQRFGRLKQTPLDADAPPTLDPSGI